MRSRSDYSAMERPRRPSPRRGLDTRPVEVGPKPERSALRPALDPGELKRYARLAKKVGFKPEPSWIRNQEFEIFLFERQMMTYDVQQVHVYLTQLAANEERTWQWVPLREKDTATQCQYQLVRFEHAIGADVGDISRMTYQHIIPLAVLQTVETILTEFPDIHFFVSDYQVPRPDPFLAAAFPHCLFHIVEMWHEPGFKPQG